MAGYKTLDEIAEKTIPLLVTSVLPVPHAHGLGQLLSKERTDAVPVLLETLFHNVSVLGDYIQSRNPNMFVKSFNRQILARPYYNYGRLRNCITKYIKEWGDIDGTLPLMYQQGQAGGYLEVYCFGKITSKSLSKSGSFYFTVGYEFEMSFRNRKRVIKKKLFAGFDTPKGDSYCYTKPLKSIPSEAAAVKMLRETTSGALRDAEENIDDGKCAQSLRKLKINI